MNSNASSLLGNYHWMFNKRYRTCSNSLNLPSNLSWEILLFLWLLNASNYTKPFVQLTTTVTIIPSKQKFTTITLYVVYDQCAKDIILFIENNFFRYILSILLIPA